MAGLTQAQVALRAGVPRPVVSAYERGIRRPSIETLERLLVGCGLRLRLAAVPEPGLEDEPTRMLLARPPAERLHGDQRAALEALAAASADPSAFLIGSHAAARLHGACVQVGDLDIWFSDEAPIEQIEQVLLAAGARAARPDDNEPGLTLPRLRDGEYFCCGRAGLQVWAVSHFDAQLQRSRRIELSPGHEIRVAAPWDCSLGWYPRDLSHLALQRAVRLVEEGG
jgi:transcriptional regulator with XRE-family HTH domain